MSGTRRRTQASTRSIAVVMVLMLSAFALQAPGASAQPPDHEPPGMVITESTRGFEETWDALIGALDANPNIRIVREIDHAAAAAGAGIALEPTREVFFGNPALGTPLMQSSQAVGIDLPQKMIVWEEGGRVFVGYNAPGYLDARHDLDTPAAQARLAIVGVALANFAGVATGAVVDPNPPGLDEIGLAEGLVVVQSAFPVDRAIEEIKARIDELPLNLIFEIDHQANAATVPLDLRPTTLLVFGNPAVGAPLMQAARTTAIDLPQKMLVWEDEDGVTNIAFNAPAFLGERHAIEGQDGRLGVITNVLGSIARAGVPQIAFIGGNDRPPSGDRPAVDRLVHGNHDVTLMDDDDLDPAALADFDLAVVSSSVVPAKIPAELAATATPLLTWEALVFDDLGMAVRSGQRSSRGTAVHMNAATADHPLSAGLTFNPDVLTMTFPINFGVVGGDAIVIASERRGAEQPVLFAYDAGTELADGSLAAGRRTAFFPIYQGLGQLTGAGWLLFDAAVADTLAS